MLVSEPHDAQPMRSRLAAELRRLREAAGVSGREMAARISLSQPKVRMSQSKVSRIESGTTVPALPAVDAWADAVGASEEIRDRLTAMTEAAFTEVHAWRSLANRGPVQEQVQDRETAARVARSFQPSVVPGLLQTAGYARRLFSLYADLYPALYQPADVPGLVAGRMNRQPILYDDERQFFFLITEAGLRWRPGPPQPALAQLDRIAVVMTLDNVSIGLIPADQEARTPIPEGFDMFDEADGDRTVTIETLHAHLTVTDPTDLAAYNRTWDLLTSMALFDDEADRFLASVRESIRRQEA